MHNVSEAELVDDGGDPALSRHLLERLISVVVQIVQHHPSSSLDDQARLTYKKWANHQTAIYQLT